MASKKYCCKGLKDLHEIKGYMSGKETDIPAIKDKKHLLCVWADKVYAVCPAYFDIEYCPYCGSKLK